MQDMMVKTGDEELLELGHEFEAAFAAEEKARRVGRETDDWDAWDIAYKRTDAIVKRIEKFPATTMQGLRIKARCVQWCYGDDPIFDGTDRDSTDYRVAHQIVRDLLAIA